MAADGEGMKREAGDYILAALCDNLDVWNAIKGNLEKCRR